jgi:hypothetical protein
MSRKGGNRDTCTKEWGHEHAGFSWRRLRRLDERCYRFTRSITWQVATIERVGLTPLWT